MSENAGKVMSGARIFAKQIEFFVGAKTTVKVGDFEMCLHGQSTVAITGQLEADYIYQLLITFHKFTAGRAEKFLTEVYGDQIVAEERVDDHEMWKSILKAAICEDRKHVSLTVEKLSQMSPDDFLVDMNDGKTGRIIDRMFGNQETDALLGIFDMYFKILWQHRAERVFADFLNVELDEANLAARMNCARPVVQLFPQNHIFGVATITLGQLPVMEHANDNLEQDHLFDCLASFVEVSREQALKENLVKLPETTRRRLKEEMERMLRKALNRNRQIVFSTLADFLGLSTADLAKQFISKPAHVTNLLYAKCYHSSGAMMSLYDRLTSIPKKLWVKDYKSSTDTSDYASDGGQRYVTPWTINDDRVEEKLKESVKEFYGKREEKAKAGKKNSGGGNTQAKENKSRKNRKINKKKQQGQLRKIRDKMAKKDKEKDTNQQLADVQEPVNGTEGPGQSSSEQECEGDAGGEDSKKLKEEIAELEKEKQRVDKVEGQLYDQLLEMDKEKDELKSKKEQLDERERRVNAEAERVQKLKRENEILLEERRRKEEQDAEERCREAQLQQQIWQRLHQISVEEAELESKKEKMNSQEQRALNINRGLTQKEQELQREREQFNQYQKGKENELKLEKEQLLQRQKQMNDQYSTNTMDLCQRLVTLATGVVSDSLAQAAAGGSPNLIDLTQPSHEQMHVHHGPPPTAVLVDIGPAASGTSSTQKTETGNKKGKTCAANCPCRDPKYKEPPKSYHRNGEGPQPVLEENIAAPMD